MQMQVSRRRRINRHCSFLVFLLCLFLLRLRRRKRKGEQNLPPPLYSSSLLSLSLSLSFFLSFFPFHPSLPSYLIIYCVHAPLCRPETIALDHGLRGNLLFAAATWPARSTRVYSSICPIIAHSCDTSMVGLLGNISSFLSSPWSLTWRRIPESYLAAGAVEIIRECV